MSRNDAAILVGGGAGAVALWWLGRRADAKPSRNGTPGPLFDFGRPVAEKVRALVTSGWSADRHDHVHHALDIRLPAGTPVLAIDAGRVVRVRDDRAGDAGIWVGIVHPSLVVSRYLHLSRALVSRGEDVERGDPIGLSGNTGNSAAPHLHLDLRAPRDLLSTIAEAIGAPRGGWGRPMEPYGYSIPGEAFIPVDAYRASVKHQAARAGIPLYQEAGHGE